MTRSLLSDALFVAFAFGAVFAAWRVFSTDSMVRAAYFLLASFAGVAAVIVLLGAPFLGLILLLMMGGEMTIMAVFMVMFMMNPAGLNPMMMVHQKWAAVVAGAVSFVGLAAVGIFVSFPDQPLVDPGDPTKDLGRELLGNSMLVFQTAGFSLLATMIGAIALASSRGRFGDAYDASLPPPLDDDVTPPVVASDKDPGAAAAGGEDVGDMAGMDHGDSSTGNEDMGDMAGMDHGDSSTGNEDKGDMAGMDHGASAGSESGGVGS